MDYTILMLIVMVAIMYFLMIRPENKRKKKAQEMRDSLKKGDVITSIGGIIGKIVSVGKDTIVIETSDDRVRVELTKWAVSTTGVAGPDPDDRGNPVGLVYVALAGPDFCHVRELHLGGVRESIRIRAAGSAFDLVRRYLTGLKLNESDGRRFAARLP